MKKYQFVFFVFSLLLINYSLLISIEVGGHLTEDTTWSPEDNPHLVTSGVYVDAGVTLTILAGTIVKFYSDYYDDLGDDQFYFHSGEEPIAKFMRVEGRIIAEGTEQDSIIFTRMQDVQYYHWGTIYLPEGAPQSSFKHCVFEFSAFTGFSLWEQPRAAIAMWNGSAMIENCNFIDNDTAIGIERNVIDILIVNNYFDYFEYPHPNIISVSGYYFLLIRYIFTVETITPLIVGNTFKNGTAIYSGESVYFVDNSIESVALNRKAIYLSLTDGINYFYNNSFGSCSTGINSHSNGTDSLYIKNNYFATNGGEGIAIDDAYVEISDNYFEGCDLDTGLNCNGQIYNNLIKEGNVRTPGYLEVYNNIGFAGEDGIIVTYRNEACYNDLSVSNQYAFDGAFSSFFNNCIFIANEEISNNGVSGNPIFRNCIIDFPLELPLIDGCGNILVDSLQAQLLFEDIQNGDFHLIEGSLAIDAGFDTLGYYYPFDMDYNARVWDGDNNGSAIIDIGPYEFGAPSFGGIEGYTYNPVTGDPVDYVLLKINNQPGEFTFTNSTGNFEYKLPAGIYDIYAERVFYEDVIEYQVEVIDGQFTNLFISMTETVEVEENEIIPSVNDFNLTNYPNPFNPTTTINFFLPEDSEVELSIYNVKGQKVKDLPVTLSVVEGSGNNYYKTPSPSTTLRMTQAGSKQYSIVWDGTDSNNIPVCSGIYLYKIKAGNQESVNRMLLLK